MTMPVPPDPAGLLGRLQPLDWRVVAAAAVCVVVLVREIARAAGDEE